MSEKTPVPPSGDATRLPIVCGKLADALDAELAAAWEDDAWMEALAHNERLIAAVADYEYAVALLRSALARLSPPDRPASDRDQGPTDADGSRPNRTGREERTNG